MEKAPIKVWRFNEAPKEYQDLSTNGGDEDWVVLVPFDFTDPSWIGWLDRIDSCYEPKAYKLPNGDRLYIGSHA